MRSSCAGRAALPMLLLSAVTLAGCTIPPKSPPEISYDDAEPAVQLADPPKPVEGRGAKIVTASRPAQATTWRSFESGVRRPPPTHRKGQCRGTHPANAQWLHQCRAGLSVLVGRPLSGLCRTGAGDRYRPAGGRAVRWLRTGRCRRHRAMDHRRYRSEPDPQTRPHPGQTTRPDLVQSRHQYRSSHLSPELCSAVPHGLGILAIPQDQLIALRRQNASAATPIMTGVDIHDYASVTRSRVTIALAVSAFDDGSKSISRCPAASPR